MKKFWQLVSRKDLVFGIVLFVLVIGYGAFESYNKVKVDFGEESVDVVSSKYIMNIPYDMVEGIELVDMPDAGEIIDGRDDMSLRYGTWENEAWGKYVVCADLSAGNAVVVHLDDGRTYVFSRRSNEVTQEIYHTFQTHLQE